MEIRRRPPNPTVRVENLEYAVPHREAQAKNILEEIVWHKDIEIKNFKKIVSLEDLIKKIDKLSAPKDFYKSILESKIKPGVIAEIKKASPSKGVIRKDFNPEDIAICYEGLGASCISVLTDKRFFQGSYEILETVRKSTNLPLLCKDFIISAYQIYKARVSGADHLIAMAPAAINNPQKALKNSFSWGLGHSSGVLLLAFLAIFIKDITPLNKFSNIAEFLVGISLLIVGVFAIKNSFQLSIHSHSHKHENGIAHR
ncbi:indole-3-glycerol phosphate synthase TrpC, partial [bacterium]|nr:indole-3-glycerol phosphate synthase TrpC [bacterium]